MILKQCTDFIVDNLHCQQCGACISICNNNAIRYSRNTETGLLDIKILHDQCVKCGRCYQICPANKHVRIDDVSTYCKSRLYYLGFNKNRKIRSMSSSGGVARTIIIEGLTNGLFDGVYTLKKTDNYPFVEGCFFTKDNIPNYNDIPNSVYHSVPLNFNMRQIQNCDNLLIVGTTCQLLALHKYVKNKCKKIYSLCIFCKQQKTFESTKFIAKIAGVKLEKFNDIKSFSYRGSGWPGYCSFNNKIVPWNIAALIPFGRKLWTVPGCNICGNPFGVDVDITVLDPWCIENENQYGKNLIIVHSKKGNDILNMIPNLEIQKKKLSEVEKALMYDDITKKNRLISYYLRETNDLKLINKGVLIERQKMTLEKFFRLMPKLPFIAYRILNKIIKDKR